MAKLRYSQRELLIVLTLLPLNIGFISGVEAASNKVLNALVRLFSKSQEEWHLAVEQFLMPDPLAASYWYAVTIWSMSNVPGWIIILLTIICLGLARNTYQVGISISLSLAIPFNALYILNHGPWYFRLFADSPYAKSIPVVLLPYWGAMGICLTATAVFSSPRLLAWCFIKLPQKRSWTDSKTFWRVAIVLYSACTLYGWIIIASTT